MVAWGIVRASDYSWALWLEHWTGDKRTAFFAHRPKRQHEQIGLVTIDDTTMFPYPYRSPIDRKLLANLVTALDNAGVKAIGLDFLFLKPTEADKDEALVNAISSAKARVVVAAADRRVEINEQQTAYQEDFLKRSGAVGGYANLLTGGDNIVRYVAESDDPKFPKSFAVALVKPGAPEPANGPRRIAWSLKPSDGNERFFTIPAHLLVTPAGTPTPVASHLLARFKDKFVMIGASFPDLDRHQTPLPSWIGDDEIDGVQIHAQVAAQLLDGRHIEHLRRDCLLGLFGILAFMGTWFGMRHGFVAYGLYATTASLAVVAADIVLFQFWDRIIPFGACLAALAAGLLGGVVLRRVARVAA